MSKYEVRVVRHAAVVAAALALASCNGVVDANRSEVAEISLSDTTVALEVGANKQLTAVVRDAAGNVLNGRQVFWSSSDTLVARISASGVVTAVALGEAQVAGSIEGKSDVARVVVIRREVASVGISPATASVAIRQTVQLTATAYDGSGAAIPDRQISWESSTPSVASVNASGAVRGNKPGVVTITARTEGRSGTAQVTVTAGPPAQLSIHQGNQQTGTAGALLADSLAVRVLDDEGNPVAGATVTWAAASGGGSVQPTTSVTSPEGIARTQWRLGDRPGNQTATATVGSQTVTFTAQGRPGRLSSITVTPANITLTALSSTTTFTATAYDASGNVIPDRTFSWSSSATGVATVNSAGTGTAVSNGTTTITAQAEGVSGTATLRVQQAVARVQVSPGSASLAVGDTLRLSATVTDANGFAVAGASVAWSSSNSSVASVNNSGRVLAGTTGSATITASSGGQSGSASITVQNTAVGSVTVTPSSASVRVGETVQLQATTYDGSGNVLTGRSVSWQSSNPTVATVNNSGRVTGVRPGNVTITATSEGKSGTASVRVDAGVPTSLVVASGDGQVGTVGSPLPNHLAVRVTDAQGNGVPGVTVTWAVVTGGGSVQPTSSTTDASGIARTQWTLGTRPGNQSAAAGVAGLGAVTFTAQARPGSTSSIVVAPGSTTLQALYSTAGFTAQAFDSNGNLLTDRDFTWSSSAGSVATINGTGVATAVGNGTTTISAQTDGVTGSASLQVTQSVAAVSVSPGSTQLYPGDAAQLTVAVTDANGYAVAGASVSWSSSSSSVASVNGSGHVTAVAPGTATITASSGGQSGGATVTVLAVVPARISVVGGDRQTGTVGAPLPGPLVVQVTDSRGSGVPGITVAWSVSAGGGAVSPPSSTTDASGHASTTWTLGTSPGSYTVSADVTGISGASFRATANPGPPASVSAVSGDGQEGRSGEELDQPLVVQVTDAYGNPLQGVQVSWAVSANGSINPAVSTTDGRGEASARWTLGPGPQVQLAEASVPGLAPVVFVARRVAGR